MKQIVLVLSAMISFISITAQPVITSNPQDLSTCVDSCAQFQVAAVGSNLSFEWFTVSDSTMAVSVGTGSSLELCDSIIALANHHFYCVVSDGNGNQVQSDSAQLTISDCLPPIADFEFQWNQMEICFENTSQRAETVIWLFGDGNTDASNVQAPCHTYMTKELFFVKLRAFNDYGEDLVEKPIDLLSAETIFTDGFEWYPNPAKEMIFLQHNKPMQHYQVIDLSGQRVLDGMINASTARIDLSSLDRGLYFLLVVSEDAQITERLIIE